MSESLAALAAAPDPTANVVAILAAAVERQDDLRDAERRQVESDLLHVKEVANLRAAHAEDLRHAEADRIDAIRAVDVGAVNRAAEVAALQATTLASQVAVSADAMRTSLANALDPIQKDIADLRRVQYEAAGQRTQVVETREEHGDRRGNNSLLVAILGTFFIAISLGVSFAALFLGK